MKLFKDLPNTDTPINAENLNQIQDNLVVVSATEPTGDNREKVWMQKGKNLFDKNNYSVFEGYISGETLKFVSNSYGRTIYLKVQPNTTYTISREVLTNYFAIGTGLSVPTVDRQVSNYAGYSNSNKATVTTGKNDNYIYIYLLWTNGETITLEEVLKSLQIEQGSTATSYEAYIEPKIYVKNDNDVYEEFISNNETILYENTSGSNGDITLNCSSTKYKRIKIFFKTNNATFNSVEVDNPNGKQVCLNSGSSSVTEEGVYYLRTKEMNINDNKITTSKYLQIGLRAEGITISEDNKIYITKVVGFE